jgi:HEAT repeat protein
MEATTLATVARVLLVLMLCGADLARGQSPSPVREAAQVRAANPDDRLARIRAIIENRDDSVATRITQAELLIESDDPRAAGMLADLLSNGYATQVKVIVCRAIANAGLRDPSQLAPALVEPLLALLRQGPEAVAAPAAEALGAFTDASVADALGAIASDAEAVPAARLAALGALRQNTHRRATVATLANLLDAQDSRIVAEVIAALRTVSAADHGDDPAAWRAWWNTQESLTDAEWLARNLKLRAQRLQRTQEAFRAFRESADARHAALAGRLAETLAALFRLIPQAERDATLVDWLADPSGEYRLAAAALVAEQISEGNLPADAVIAALVKRYADELPEVRKLAVEIVGALNEPKHATAMLDRLALEKNNGVRETVLRVLGKLRNPDAVDPLLAELARPDASDACVSAAADSLGVLAERGAVSADQLAAMIEPLKLSFVQARQRSRAVRIALLGAMAATGSADFKPEFEAHLAHEDSELLLRAIRGVAVVGNGAQLDRLGNLASHPDARVRQRAIAALGKLGGQDQLSTVVARMNPGVEPVDGPRQAAWEAFRAVCERMPLAEQISAADRLADLPGYRVRYLEALHTRLAKAGAATPELSRVRETLARAYAVQGRNGDAFPLWRGLFRRALETSDPRRHEIAMAFLDCAVATDKPDALGDIVNGLIDAADATREAASATIVAYLERMAVAGRDDAVAGLAAVFAQLPEGKFDRLRDYRPPVDPNPPPANSSGIS